jgi:hypothetical protein
MGAITDRTRRLPLVGSANPPAHVAAAHSLSAWPINSMCRYEYLSGTYT